jgi:hypothetical protein
MMRGQFKHLNFKTFIMCHEGPIWCFFAFPTKALNVHDSHTNATPKVEMHLGVIGLHPLHSPPFMKVCFTPKHILLASCPLHSTLNHEPNVRVVTPI